MKRQDEMYRGDIGEILHVFRSSKRNVLAGLVLAVLMFGGGVALLYSVIKGIYTAGGVLPFWAEHGWCWLAIVGWAAIAIFLVYQGISMLWFSGLYLASYQVRIGETGLDIQYEEIYLTYAWSEIQHVKEIHSYFTLPIIHGTNIGPELGNRIFIVTFNDGKFFAFGANEVKEYLVLASYLKHVADHCNIPWEIEEKHN